MIILYQSLFLLISYLIAAIPFGLFLTKIFTGKDIREFGSKNIGATNVTRVVGKKLGILTLLLDGLKGAIMVIFARFIFFDVEHLHLLLVLVAAVSVIGHVFPIYLNFKGGKGVATTLAVLFALDLKIGFFVLCFWIGTFVIFRVSAISSLVAILSSVLLSIFYKAPIEQIIFCILLFVLILYRHKDNIKRLKEGKENKV